MQDCNGTDQYGSAGVACIADRQQGACHYQVNGQCWNWFTGYHDPIANDPQVTLNTASGVLPASITSVLHSGIDPVLLPGGALLLAVLVVVIQS